MLTAGAVLDHFYKNPVLLWNHQRPEGNTKNQILPLGHWEDLEVVGDEIWGTPFFDDKDEFAMQVYHKVEAGHIRACSAGADPLETSKKKSDLLPGQKLATVTKWILKEASICDIGANPDSLSVALYDSSDRQIKLSDTLIPKIETMAKKTTTAAEALAALKKAQEAKKTLTDAVKLAQQKVEIALADEETSEEEKTQLSEGAEEHKEMSDEDKDAEIEKLKAKLAELTEQLRLAQEQAQAAESQKEEAKAAQLADKAVALRKITLAQRADLIMLAKANYPAAEKFLANIKPTPSIKEKVEGSEGVTLADKDAERIKKLSEKSFDELFNSKGELQELKLKAPDVYKLKYKEKFGKEPKNV